MNSGLNKYLDPYNGGDLWSKWLQATGVDSGYGYRVPVEVWNAAWNGNWPDDELAIRWILEEYLDLETAKAAGYLELVLPLREQAEAALNAAKRPRQVKIDADIDEVIKIIRGLGREPDEKASAGAACSEKPSRKRHRWMRSTTATIIAAVVAALVGFAGGYQLRALDHTADIAVPRSPEVRRAIPVEPEVRRAIPVEPEIRRAIPVQNTEPQVDRRPNSSMPATWIRQNQDSHHKQIPQTNQSEHRTR
jgi:hypothetical protein